MPGRRRAAYREAMRLRTWARRHVDVLVGVLVAVVYAVEVALYPRADQALAVPLAVAVGAALVFRRRLPLATFVVVSLANYGVLATAPGFDGRSGTFVLVFVLNLWSLGRNATGVEAWLGAVGVLVTVATFVVGDGAHDPSSIL